MKRILVVFLVALALFLGACGSDSDDSVDGADTTAADDGDAAGAGDVAAGEETYQASCASCHGEDLEGGVGLALAGSEFVAETSEGDLVAFIKVGRPASDPDNQTGTDMAPKGGDPSLTDEDLADIAAYLKSQN